jgi:hypothetical protein
MDNDEALMNAGRPLPKARVGELVEILSEVEASDDDQDTDAAIGEQS